TDGHLLTQLEETRSVTHPSRLAYLLGLVHLERRDGKAAAKLLQQACAAPLAEPSLRHALARAQPTADTAAPLDVRTFLNFITCAAEGTGIVTAGSESSDDKYLMLWEAASGRSLRTFRGHAGSITSAVFSRDGSQVLSGSADKTMRLWDAASGHCLRSFEGHTDGGGSVALSPDGTRAVSHTVSGIGWSILRDGSYTLRLWEVASGRCVHERGGRTTLLPRLSFSQDGILILSTSHDGQKLRLSNIAAERRLCVF